MLKVKHERECDCVVAGFRWHKGGDGDGRRLAAARPLRRRGRPAARRRVGELHRRRSGSELVDVPRAVPRGRARVAPVEGVGRTGTAEAERGRQRMPGGKSRWSQGKDLSWEPLRPELVVEVAYDHMQGTRFRHTAQFRRWRTDKAAARVHVRAARGRARRRSSRRSSRAAADAVGASRDVRRAFLAAERSSRHSRVGSSSGSGVSCGGRCAFGHVTQVHADARPGRRAAAHRVDEHVVDREVRRGVRVPLPSSARARRARRPCRRVGDDDERHLRLARRVFGRRRVVALPRLLRARRRDARRLALALRKCGGHGASPSPAASSRAASSSSFSSEPGAPRRSPACGSPSAAKRAGIVSTVKSAGSQSGDLVPPERRRHARVGQRAHRVRRARRAVLGVLVVVEEDAVALLLPPLRRGDRRARAARSRARAPAPRGAPR